MLRALLGLLTVLALTVAGPAPTAGQEKKDAPPGPKEGAAKVEMSRAEQTILDLTNKERAKEKLPPLKPNALLFQIARAHSANMAKKGQMNHVLDGKNPAQRTLAGGYDYKHVGENLGESDGAPLRVIVQGWMNSKHHRDNILKREFTEIGLGVVRNGKGDFYYTQLFGTPKKKQ
ncbi:MAG TPA: CAP domain-containing protein [Gemmataceae bacterium]|jgi:uncharacterized protein YkwD|nr:CAP domain-containing protein [Gemmataceae bacterium]